MRNSDKAKVGLRCNIKLRCIAAAEHCVSVGIMARSSNYHCCMCGIALAAQMCSMSLSYVSQLAIPQLVANVAHGAMCNHTPCVSPAVTPQMALLVLAKV